MVAGFKGIGIGKWTLCETLLEYGRQVDAYLAQFTHYRSLKEIHALYSRHFSRYMHVEEKWASARKSHPVIGRVASMPRVLQQRICRLIAGSVIVAVK